MVQVHRVIESHREFGRHRTPATIREIGEPIDRMLDPQNRQPDLAEVQT